MKQIFILLVVLSLSGGAALRAQDAATEERLKKLGGLIQDLQESKEIQHKQIENLAKEIQTLREQTAKPSGNYASQDDLRELAKKLQEIDKKRIEDNEKILKEIKKLGEKMSGPGSRTQKQQKEKEENPGNAGGAGGGKQKGLEHTVAEGDFLSTIAQSYREKGIKVTTDQILKANPGLVPEKMKVGQKIFIPTP